MTQRRPQFKYRLLKLPLFSANNEQSGSPQPDKSRTSSEVSSSTPNPTPYPHVPEDIWTKEPTTSQAEGGGVDDNTQLNTLHVDPLGLRNDNLEARICVQIAIKNLPY